MLKERRLQRRAVAGLAIHCVASAVVAQLLCSTNFEFDRRFRLASATFPTARVGSFFNETLKIVLLRRSKIAI
jgi:hypothetical protein